MRFAHVFAAASLASTALLAPSHAQDGPVVRSADFAPVVGDDWVGSLTYLDYSSGERTSIPVKAQVKIVDDATILYRIQYPGEEQYNAQAPLRIKKKGREFDGQRVTHRLSNKRRLKIITQGTGTDDNKPADIQIVYEIRPDTFSIKKNVRFDGVDEFFNRNVYRFERESSTLDD